MPHLAIFASGSGTNAENLVHYFDGHPTIRIRGIFCNNPGAGILEKNVKLGIPLRVFHRTEFNGNSLLEELQYAGVDYILLAGFLWKLPSHFLIAYPGRIFNIHPSLLPLFGGAGMYGLNVHAAVLAAGEKETGISIHRVDESYDTGEVIFQAKCPVLADDTPARLAARVHDLEMKHYPRVIEETIQHERP